MEEKILGKSFEEMQTEEIENVFGGTDENIEPRITPVAVPISVKVTAVISGAALSAVSGIVSYNKECLG